MIHSFLTLYLFLMEVCMKSFLLSLLAIATILVWMLALSLPVRAEPPITRYAKLGWIGHYDATGTRVTWAKTDVSDLRQTEMISTPCPYCDTGFVAGTSDRCGFCSGSRFLPCELVHAMPTRELLAHKGCGCVPACDCVGCNCDAHTFVSEPLPPPQTVTVNLDQLQAIIDAAVEKALQKRFPATPTASAPTCAQAVISPATYYYSDSTAGACTSGSCGSTGGLRIFGGRFRRR
jgi:hypothetical protein